MVFNPVSLGEKLRNRRIELGLSQSQVARILDTKTQYVYSWENNYNIPIVSRYPKIIEFLGYFPFDFDTSTWGGKIKKYRFFYGLSQEDLAKELGINESTLFHYENGRHKPSIRIAKKLERLICK